jgi:ubiquinone/menaquinone biosynthesis C-methylase UbiE
MRTLKPNTSEHWSDYWAAGRLTSLPDDFAGNYDGEIAEFWSAQFADVPEGGRIVDLCTGNGAIALLAAEYLRSQGRVAEVLAVDAARINPDAIGKAHPGMKDLVGSVTFIGESPVESLALPEASADLVTSQYGIEYCDWAAAAAKVQALLKPGGRLALVCHAATSDIVATMETEAAGYAQLTALDIPRAIRRFLAGTLSFSRFRKHLQNAQGDLLASWRLSGAPLYAFVLQTIDGVLAMNEARLRGHRLQLAAFGRQLTLGEARLADMLRVNRAIHAQPEWHQVFERAGLELLESREILYKGKHRSGQAYRFAKPA